MTRLKIEKTDEPTFQSSLSSEEIAQRLSNYVPVDDISMVPIGTHVRYFIQDKNDKNAWKFRLGGFVYSQDNPIYLILSTSRNGDGKTWTVSREEASFFRVKPISDDAEILKELDTQYQEALISQQEEINKLKKELNKYKKSK